MTIREQEIATFYPWNPNILRTELTRTSSCR